MNVNKDIAKSTKYLEQSYQLAGIGYWEYNLATKALYWSEQTYSIFDYPITNDPLGIDDFYTHVVPSFKDRVKRFAKLDWKNQPHTKGSVELELLNKKNETKYVEIHYCFDGNETLFGTIQDITQKKRYEQQLKTSARKSELLVDISSLFLNIYDFNKQMNLALKALGEQLNVSRVYVFENFNDNTFTRNTFEWVEKESLSQIQYLQEVNLNDLPSWNKLLTENQQIKANNIHELADDIVRILEPQQIKSILVFPLNVFGKYYGFVGFDECKYYRVWEFIETEILQAISNILSNALERKISYDEIKQSEEKFRTIVETSKDAIFITDFKGDILEVNKAAEELLGFSATELQQMNTADFESKIITGKVDKILSEIRQSQQLLFGTEMLNKEGKVISIDVRSNLMDYNGKRALLNFVRDITDREQVERKIMSAVIEAEDNERKRIAEQLHDDLAPLLSSVKIYMEIMQRSSGISLDETSLTIFNKAKDLLGESIEHTRGIAHNLMPNELVDFGLRNSIQSFCLKIQQLSNVIFHLDLEETSKAMDKNVEIIVFRIVKELVNNTLKHANASEVSIGLKAENEKFKIEYSDNGKGFDFNEVFYSGQAKGMGLSNIVGNVNSLGGKLHFDKNSDLQGTKIIIYFNYTAN